MLEAFVSGVMSLELNWLFPKQQLKNHNILIFGGIVATHSLQLTLDEMFRQRASFFLPPGHGQNMNVKPGRLTKLLYLRSLV